jgi:hypothetical protein
VSPVEQELPTLAEYLSSPPVFSGIRVAWILVLCLCFVDRCLSFCTFSFGYCVPHKTSFTPPRFVEVPVLKQESERSCICVRGIYFASFYHFSNFIFWKCGIFAIFHFSINILITYDLVNIHVYLPFVSSRSSYCILLEIQLL